VGNLICHRFQATFDIEMTSDDAYLLDYDYSGIGPAGPARLPLHGHGRDENANVS